MKLYTTPLSVHVDDVTVVSSLLGNGSASLSYVVDVFTSSPDSVNLVVSLEEREGGGSVVEASLSLPGCKSGAGGCVVRGSGQLIVDTPRLWWPWTMRPDDPGYLYTLKVHLPTYDYNYLHTHHNMFNVHASIITLLKSICIHLGPRSTAVSYLHMVYFVYGTYS